MTVPDRDLLLFLAAHELVTAAQAAALLEITDTAATEQLDELCDRRLASRVRLSSRLPAAYRPTPEGADQIDSTLPPSRALDWARYRHEIGAAWLWVSGRNGRFGRVREVLSRREMQAADETLRTESLLDTPGVTFADQPESSAGTDAREIYPDLGLVQADHGWVTLDLVLSPPAPERYTRMVGRGHRDRLIRGQLYLVEQDHGIDQALKATAQRLGLSDQVHVQHLAKDGIADT